MSFRYEESNELATRGWRTSFAQLVGHTLEDVRVHRQAIKINDKLHTVSAASFHHPPQSNFTSPQVNCYRDCNRIFFSAYDPDKSLYRSCSVDVSQVGSTSLECGQARVDVYVTSLNLRGLVDVR